MTTQDYDALALVTVAVKSTTYTASANQIVPCDLSGGAFTVTLPTAPPDRTSMVIKIVKQAGTPNTLTVACGGSDVFNVASGSTTGTMTLLNQAMRLQYSTTGAIWYVVSTDAPLSQLDARYVAGTTASGKSLTLNNSLTLAGTDGTTMTFPSTSATIARTDAANTFTGHQTIEGVTSTGATGTGNLVFATSPTLTTPALGTPSALTLTNATGLPLTGLASAAYNTTPTASTLAEWDSNANLSANAHLALTTSTATAAGTTTLTIASTQVQVFTGSSTQTVKLPTTSVPAGLPITIVNQSSGAVTVQSSGANNIAVLNANTFAAFVSQKATPTAAADWAITGLTSTVNEYTSTQSGVSVPAGITGVWIESLIAPGGGGASGRKGAAGTVRCGGGGGASGGMITMYWLAAAKLGSTYTVTLPAAGTGGAAVTTNDTNGNAGGLPSGPASFVSGSTTVECYTVQQASVGGTNALGTGGVGGLGMWPGVSGGSASATGGAGGQGALSGNGAPTGGGSGGGITSGDSASAGGAGGWQTLNYHLTNAAGGVVGGASPGTGNAAVASIGGLGGGGGAASITGNAQDGATPTGYGAGGGGGGAALNSTGNSGNGGGGGPAYCRLRWVYV